MSTADISSNVGPLPPLALIAGPTASGKSDLAARLALALRASGRQSRIINADSSQVYADLRVLSARPTEAEMQGIPHRLFGERDGALLYSAADWAAKAREIVCGCAKQDVIPILVGGSGLYIRALIEGIAPVPRIEPAVRAEVRTLSPEDAYAALLREDPLRANRLHPADIARVARSLEVLRSSGSSLTYWQSLKSFRLVDHVALHPLILLPDRDLLNARCDARFAAMVDGGAVEEVVALLARDLDPDLPVMRAIGVREIAAWLRGETTREQAIAAGQLATRQYAKRQYTWFRRQPPPNWPRADPESCNPLDYLASLLRI